MGGGEAPAAYKGCTSGDGRPPETAEGLTEISAKQLLILAPGNVLCETDNPKREPKSLNKDYNLDYNIDRRKANTAFNAHVFHRKEYWNLDFDRIEETVRTGKIREDKCREPNKICFERYFGKENCTYTVIVRYHKDFIEVKTAWRRKGR